MIYTNNTMFAKNTPLNVDIYKIAVYFELINFVNHFLVQTV